MVASPKYAVDSVMDDIAADDNADNADDFFQCERILKKKSYDASSQDNETEQQENYSVDHFAVLRIRTAASRIRPTIPTSTPVSLRNLISRANTIRIRNAVRNTPNMYDILISVRRNEYCQKN
jgi:hypothetical protein